MSALGRRTPLRIVLEVLREPMLALLLGGGAIYLALGDLKEALIHYFANEERIPWLFSRLRSIRLNYRTNSCFGPLAPSG